MRSICLVFLLACGPASIPGGDGARNPTGSTGPKGATYAPVTPPATTHGPVPAPSGTSMSMQADPTPATLYGSTFSKIVLEVAYQPNAEPYTGSVGPLADIWQIFRDNSAALFQGKGKTIEVPNVVGQMQQLPAGVDQDYTLSEILDTAHDHRMKLSGNGTAAYYVMFFDGYYADGDGRHTNVLGISIGGTPLIALFKPVIKSTRPTLPPNSRADRYVEQATLVHEFGHAVGLVDNGVPMVSAHLDTEHGKHCSNPDCGMYYANEGAGAATDFLTDYFDTGSTLLFDDACLDDVHAMH